MPYVVHLQNKYDIAAPQPLFTFVHPNKGRFWPSAIFFVMYLISLSYSDSIIDNSRYEVKKFVAKQNAVLHGLSGYFDAVLWGDITLSIEPNTHSPGMVSWFPIFFPIKVNHQREIRTVKELSFVNESSSNSQEAVIVNGGDEVEVHFWRRCNAKNVWYEWCVSKPTPGSIHNPNGRSYTIGLWMGTKYTNYSNLLIK